VQPPSCTGAGNLGASGDAGRTVKAVCLVTELQGRPGCVIVRNLLICSVGQLTKSTVFPRVGPLQLRGSVFGAASTSQCQESVYRPEGFRAGAFRCAGRVRWTASSAPSHRPRLEGRQRSPASMIAPRNAGAMPGRSRIQTL